MYEINCSVLYPVPGALIPFNTALMNVPIGHLFFSYEFIAKQKECIQPANYENKN